MKRPFLPELKLCLFCFLLCTFPSSPIFAGARSSSIKDAGHSSRAPEPPVPWVIENPLRPDVFYASGRYPFWSNPRGAWISWDGKHVAFYAHQARSAEEAQGISRTLVVKDVEKDTVVLERSILTREESLFRAGAFNESLAKVHAWEAMSEVDGYRFQPMASAELPAERELDASDACYAKQLHLEYSLSLDGLKVSYKEPRLQVWRRSRKILDRPFPSWILHQQGCELSNPSWMKRVFVDRTRGVALVELEFCGSHGCLEPASAFHVLHIPEEPSDGHSRAGAAHAREARPPSLHQEPSYSGIGMDYYATGFPAMSKDGSLIALVETFAETRTDGPVFRVSLRRPDSDEVVERHLVVTAQEYSAAKASRKVEQLDKAVLERMRQINDFLGRTPWIPLVEQAVSPRVADFCQQAPDQSVQLDHHPLLFQQGHLRLDGSPGAPRAWNLPDESASWDAGTPLDASLPAVSSCGAATRSFIDAAYADVRTGVVLLRFATCGSETCPESFRGYHALTWR